MSTHPKVSGISPSEGPLGTRITIRGQNFGANETDLHSVFVCGLDCTKHAKWISSGKVTCLVLSNTLNEPKKGQVVITTKSGGESECPLFFSITFSKIKSFVTSSVWIEEDYSSLVPGSSEVVEMDVKEIKYEPDPLGILALNSYSNGKPYIDDSFIEYSAKLSESNFHPAKFCLERHFSTPFQALKQGYLLLEKNMNSSISSNVGGGTGSGQLIGDTNVVVDIISDMHKLATLSKEGKTKNIMAITSSIKNQTELIYKKITNNFGKLIKENSRMLLLIGFSQSLTDIYPVISIPRAMNECIENNGGYGNVLSSCDRIASISESLSDPRFKPILEAVEVRATKFSSLIITNLSKVYPIYFSALSEILKSLDSFKERSTDFALELLKSHQNWVSQECDHFSKAYSILMKRRIFYYDTFKLSDSDLSGHIKKVSTFLSEFCTFFAREFNVSSNIIEWKSLIYKSALKSNKKRNEVLLSLGGIDETIVAMLQSYFTALKSILFHPWNILTTDETFPREYFNIVTSLNISEISNLLEYISLVSNVINASTIHHMLENASVAELKNGFKFTFSDIYFTKLRDTYHLISENVKYHAGYCIIRTTSATSFIKTPNDEYINMTYCDLNTSKIYQIIYSWISKVSKVVNSIADLPNKNENLISPTDLVNCFSFDDLSNSLSSYINTYLKSKSHFDMESIIRLYSIFQKFYNYLPPKLRNLALKAKMWNKCSSILAKFESYISAFDSSLFEICNKTLSKLGGIFEKDFVKKIDESSNPSNNSVYRNTQLDLSQSVINYCIYLKKMPESFSNQSYQEFVKVQLDAFCSVIKKYMTPETTQDQIVLFYENSFIIESIYTEIFKDEHQELTATTKMLKTEIFRIDENIASHISEKAQKYTRRWINIILPYS